MSSVPNKVPNVITASGTIVPAELNAINAAAVLALVIAPPTQDAQTVVFVDETGHAHTLSSSALNGGSNTITFSGTAGASVALVSRNGSWWSNGVPSSGGGSGPTKVASGAIANAAPTSGGTGNGAIAEYTFAVPGALLTDTVIVTSTQALTSGGGPFNVYALMAQVSSPGNVTVLAYNATNPNMGSPLGSGAEFNFNWMVLR